MVCLTCKKNDTKVIKDALKALGKEKVAQEYLNNYNKLTNQL